MSLRLPVASVLSVMLFVTPSSATPLPEAGNPLAAIPPPYTAHAAVLSSSLQETILEITISPTAPGRLPSSEALPLGLLAIAPTGNVRASVMEADGASVADLDALSPLTPSDLPEVTIQLGTAGIWRDLRVVDVFVAPCWQTGSGALLARRLVVRVENIGGSGINEKTRAVEGVSPIWDRLYRRHVLNYESLNMPRLDRGTGKRYIVISRTAFDTQTPQFVEWKTRQGYGVEVKTLESLGYSGSSITTDACLNATKNYILNAYNTWTDGLDFVLLVGDMESGSYAGSVWTKNFNNVFYGQGNRPHDQWYGYLEGDDVFADIMVGRFPDANTTRMDYIIGKSVGYEQTPYVNGTWQKNALMTLATYHWDPNVNQHITAAKNFVSDLLSAWGMNVTERFQSQANSSQILPVVNQGVTFYNCRVSSCSSTDWNGTFSSYDVAYVNNTNKLGVWSVLSCSSAHFDNNTTTAELLLQRDYTTPSTPKGAVAFVGSQAYTSYLFNDPLDQGIYLAWADSGATLLGQALLSGKLYAWTHATGLDPGEPESGMKEYTILGDPSLQVSTDVPQPTTANVSPTGLVVGQTVNVTVSVGSSVGPVDDALVCLRKSPEVYVWGYTNSAGQVTLSATPATVGDIDLTVTAYNQQPVLTTIPVITSGPYVVYDSNTILGDGQADIGETVSMNVLLHNIGTQTAPAVQATLNCTTPQITVTGATRSYGDIVAGATALPALPFTFQVGSLGDGSSVPFDLDIASASNAWDGDFSVTIHAPVLSRTETQTDDASGNGNGNADPGETVGVSLVIQNTGSTTAQDVQLTLSEADPYVTISPPNTQSMGNIAASSQAPSPAFTVTVSSACPPAHGATMQFSLSSNGGVYTTGGSFTLRIGLLDLLFVDTDNEVTETRITDALAALGVDYSRWNTFETGMGTVPVDTLLKYRTVLWAAGDQNQSSVTAQNQTNLSSYLDQGGALLLSAENYSSNYSSATFTSNYLHVGSFTQSSGSVVVGEIGDPIGDGVSVTLSYPAGLSDSPDGVNPGTGSATVFRMQGNNDPVVIRYPSGASGAYKVIFFGAALEAFSTGGTDPNNIETVVARSLTWLGGDVLAPTAPSNPSLASDGTLTWSPAIDNVGVDHYCIYRSLMAYYEVQGMTPVTTTTGTSIQMTEGIGDPDIDYFYRITAQDAAGNQSPPTSAVGEYERIVEP